MGQIGGACQPGVVAAMCDWCRIFLYVVVLVAYSIMLVYIRCVLITS
jgi:hypothetical protein